MKVNLFRRVPGTGATGVASSSKSRSLRLETLEKREFLDASDVVGMLTSTADVDCADEAIVAQVDDSIDLSEFGQEAVLEVSALTLEAPEELTLGVYDVDTGNLPMKWTGVADADGYRIEYTTDGGKSWKSGATVGGDKTERIASKVHTDMEYIFRVQAFNDTTESEWTYSEAFYYAKVLPSATDNFQLGRYDSANHTLEMEWDQVAHVDGYRVQYSIDGGTSWYNSAKMEGEESTSRTAWSVYADREYQFRVCTYNQVGNSEWVYSEMFHVNYDDLDSPSSIMFGTYDAANQTLETSWGAVDKATGYEVQYSLDKGKTWKLAQKLYDGDETSRLAKSVVPGTTYEFRVRAFNSNGMSDWTYSELYTPPALLTAPSFLEVVDYDPLTCQLELSWGDVPDEDGYKIEYLAEGEEDWTVAFKTPADVTTGVALDIKPGVNYKIHVRAYNETDVSPWTEIDFYYSQPLNTNSYNYAARF